MSRVIGIVDYGVAGNIHSIKRTLEYAGGKVIVIRDAELFDSADKIIIPGVGSFRQAMDELNKDQLIEPLKNSIHNKPTLGICLGMHLLANIGFEYGKTSGLGVVEAKVDLMKVDFGAKVPHMGFNSIDVIKKNSLLSGVEEEEFYFMHSYEMVNYHDVISTSTYAGHQFVSAINSGNIYGVQFHPEKSRQPGIQLFENFVQL